MNTGRVTQISPEICVPGSLLVPNVRLWLVEEYVVFP